MHGLLLRTALTTSLTALGLGLPALAQSTDIGSVAAVNRDMTGTPPQQDLRNLEIGNEVVEDERVQTSDLGSGQLVFIDQTTLTVSPNTDIVLDNYVFDASADRGDMALTMTRGALRFIGGRITKQRRAIIRTPTATIGIRGGLVIIEVSEDGTTRVTQMAGESTTVQSYGDSDGDGVDDGPTGDELETFLDGGDVSGGGGITLSRSGAVAQTGGGTQTGQGQGGAGEPKTVTYEGLTTPEELEDAYNNFEGSRTGGNPNPPSNPQVVIATQAIVPLNSEQPGGANTSPVSTSGESQPTFVSGSEPIETNPVTSGDAPESIETNDAFNDIIDGNDGGQVADGIPSGGSILSATLGFDPFVSIQAGSLIGTTLAGDVITLNTPTDSSGFLNVDDANFFAFQRFQNAGLFLLDSSTSSSQDLGPLTGVGFADLDNEFYFAIAVPTG
ncbi:MAG: FecR domain-containing protein, partial [Pseudomonadota bacterium]